MRDFTKHLNSLKGWVLHLTNIMPNQSVKTKAFSFRLPVELCLVLEHRFKRGKGRWKNLNDYLRDRAVTDLKRKR